MAEQWPAALQQYLNQEGFGLKKGKQTIRSETETGPAKVRRRTTKSVDQMTGSIIIEGKDDFDTFENFYDTTLGAGVLPFEFAHPITLVVEEWRFVGEYQYTTLGSDKFRIGMTWEKLP